MRRRVAAGVSQELVMLRKLILGAAASLSALVVLPAPAQADHRHGYYGSRHYDSRYYGGYRHRYRPGDYYPIRRRSAYRRHGYGRSYGYAPTYGYGYGRRYRGRCGDGTTGAIVGGAAGALVGREVGRDGRRYRYRRGGGGGTVGAIVGGAIGALVGREIDRSC
jgi:hypothetical protein